MTKINEQIGAITRQRIYDFLVEFMRRNGFAPTVREIADGVGLKSTSSVYAHLLKLHDMGKIHMEDNKPRAIRLIGYQLRKTED
ncbi:MAG: hypothetical protein IJN64_14125 [Lachnospiraceae bacterium]|nr:hypothetical protein [Lachnospiraceae bacterium]